MPPPADRSRRRHEDLVQLGPSVAPLRQHDLDAPPSLSAMIAPWRTPPRFSSRKAFMVQPSSPRKTRRTTREQALEQELGQIFDRLAVGNAGGLEALRLRLGLTGTPPVSLAAAGDAVGLTRERVRQIESRFIQAVRKVQPPTPVLDEALRLVEEILPATDQEVERALIESDLTKEGFSFRSLVSAARVFGKPTVFYREPEKKEVASRPSPELPQRFVFSQARGLTLRWGASTFEVLLAELAKAWTGDLDPALVHRHLAAMPSFEWLDDEQEWFWVKNAPPRNRLLDQIEKIVAVAGPIDVGELRAGLGRHPRTEGFRPPREVLARLCVQSDRYRREGDRILQAGGHHSWSFILGPSLERRIVTALFEHGPAMRSEDIERAVTSKWGVSAAFESLLRTSPVLARYAPGVYGLRGARVKAAQVKALIPPRLQHQRLLDHRWSEDGRAWLGVPVSSATLRNGALALPSSLRRRVAGSYSLTSERGSLLGTLLITDSQLQDLDPFFRRWGIEAGDYVLFDLDLARGLVMATAGGEELLLRFQPGE